MAAMDGIDSEIRSLFEAKRARRKQLAKLTFAEKVKAVVILQQIVEPILRQRGKQVRVWKIEDDCRKSDTPVR
jgi:hypothetical protein